jgi:hypothetical protein
MNIWEWFLGIGLIVLLAVMIFCFWTIYDVLKSKRSVLAKFLWIISIIFFGIVASILWLFFRRKR